MTPEQERELSLNTMRRPWTWPNWPFLPLKLRSSTGGWPKLGFLVQLEMPKDPLEGDIHFVEGTFVGGTAEQFRDAQKADIRQLVSDGWVVD